MQQTHDSPRSLYALFVDVSDAHADEVAYRQKRGDTWEDVTWRTHRQTVERLTRGLIALGMQPGDRVAILGQTRLEWIQADMATVCGGGVTVGIYPSSLAPECAHILNHSEASIVVVEDDEQLAKLESVQGQLTSVRHVIRIDGAGSETVLDWNELQERGESVAAETVKERGDALGSEDLASLVYTSGTTGTPKGAMISHGNLLFSTWSVQQCLPCKAGDSTLLFLPLAHVFARLIAYYCMRKAMIVAFAESIQKVGDNLRETSPDFIASVPRIFEKVHEKITTGAAEAGGLKKKIFDWSLGVGLEVSALEQAGKPIPGPLGLKRGIAHRLVFGKIHAALGGNLQFAVSGAAPLNQKIAEFFHACGVLILEGIGMTENTSFTNVNRIDRNRFGTVGPVGPGVEMKLATDGEVLFRGPNVMLGYYKNPEATAETIDEEGWLHTGDIGEVDSDGFLRITDRKKDVIITAGGKNIAPQRVERSLRTSRYISQVVAFGDRQKFLTALVTLEPENIAAWAGENGLAGRSLEELSREPRVRELIEAEIDRGNSELASFETIKQFEILPHDLSIETGELTPTLKVKRKVVAEKFGNLVEAMYAD